MLLKTCTFRYFQVSAFFGGYAFYELRKGKPQRFLKKVSSTLQNTALFHSSAHIIESDFRTTLATAYNVSHDARQMPEHVVRKKNKRYVELVLILDNCNCSYPFEIRHFPKGKANRASINNLKLEETKLQLTTYSQSEKLRTIPNLILDAVVYLDATFNTLKYHLKNMSSY